MYLKLHKKKIKSTANKKKLIHYFKSIFLKKFILEQPNKEKLNPKW